MRLDRRDLALTLRAIGLLVAARIALRTLGYARVRAWLERSGVRSRGGVADQAAQQAGAVRRALGRAARTVPGSRCLARGLVAYRMLGGAGIPAVLTIGVERNTANPNALNAHAWVTVGTVVVTGDEDGVAPEAFVPLTRIGAGP
jgi:hypothetical protein